MTPEGRKAFVDHAAQLRTRCDRPTRGRPCPGKLRHLPVMLGPEPGIITRCSVCDTYRLGDDA